MNKRDGFTAVELVVAVVIIGILLTIATVGYRSTQISARNKEREADVATIANYLESIYNKEIKSGSLVIKKAGSYPATSMISNATYFNIIFEGLPDSAARAPGSTANSIMHATTPPDVRYYYYVPVQSNGGICNDRMAECRSFFVRYKLEGVDDNNLLVRSKRQ